MRLPAGFRNAFCAILRPPVHPGGFVMDQRTRMQLEFLSRWYSVARSSTLRLLRDLTEEELAWQPHPACHSAAGILLALAVAEELRIQRRLAGRRLLPDSLVKSCRAGARSRSGRSSRAGKEQLERLLRSLRNSTMNFLRGLLFGREKSRSPDVLQQLESLILQETQGFGQVLYLRGLRSGQPASFVRRLRVAVRDGHLKPASAQRKRA